MFPGVRNALTVDAQLIGFPMNLHRENTLHYVKSRMTAPPADLERTALRQGLSPRMWGLPFVTPRLSSYWITLITRED